MRISGWAISETRSTQLRARVSSPTEISLPKAGLNLRPKSRQTGYDMLATLSKQSGKDPDRVPVGDSFSEARRTVIEGKNTKQDYVRIIL